MTVMFIGYEEANLGTITPVMRALERARIGAVLVPGIDFKAHRGLREATTPPGIASRSLGAWRRGTPACSVARAALLARAARQWVAAPVAAPPGERLVAAELDRFLAQPAMPEIFAAWAHVEAAAARLVERERPDLIVLPEDSDYLRGRLLSRVLAAHADRIVCLTPWYYAAFASYPLIGRRRAAHYLVGTRTQAARLRAAGAEARAITIVGHPELDAVSPTPPPAPGSFLFALQGLPWEREIADDLMAILREQPRARLLVKPHPALPEPRWLARLRRPANVRVARATADAAGLLARSHCLIAQSSRMLWEASLSGRSVLIPHYAATPLPIAVPACDRSAVVVRTATALRHGLEATLAGGGRGLSRRVIAPHHPHAAARAAALLGRLLRRR